jgi:hypothetical protein
VSLAPAEGLPMSCDESIADIGIGGDPVIGTTHIDALAAFETDPEPRPS